MPLGVYRHKPHSEETKRKISESNKGRVVSSETREKIKLANLGKKRTEETKRKIGLVTKGKKNPKHSEWMKKNGPMIGKHHSEETKRKMSKAKLGNQAWLGRKHLESTKEKLRGKNSVNWKGGISKDKAHYKRKRRNLKHNATGSHTLGEWETLKAQYNWTCPACRRREPEVKLSEDHIIPLSKGGSDNIENIQPLCRNCNSKKQTKTIKYEL